MGKIGNSLIKELVIEDLQKELRGLYALEQIKVYLAKVALNQLAGMSEVILREALQKVVAEGDQFAEQLAERIARLGGTLPWDQAQLVSLCPIELKEPPTPNAMAKYGEYLLGFVREAIVVYCALTRKVKDKDVITYYMLLPIATWYINLEDELESFLGVDTTMVSC